MLSSFLLPAAALLAFVSAAPQIISPPPTGGLTYYVIPNAKLNGHPIDGQLINANGGGFFVGKETSTDCPGDFAGCGSFTNITMIAFTNENSGSGNMTAAVPGGQQVYVSTTGELKYTAPGSPIIPAGGIDTGFIYVDNFPTDEAIYQSIFWRGPKWVACPVEEGIYQIFAASIQTSADCLEIEMQVNARGTRGAPQAYEYSVAV